MSDDAVDKFFDEMVSPASTPTESTPPDEADKPGEPDAIMDDYWGKWDNMEYKFYWPFCLTTVGKAGNHSIAVACLYHESILACGETNMYADTYMD